MIKLAVKTAPATAPVTLVEAKAHLRVVCNDDDTIIGGFIQAATLQAEAFLNRAVVNRTYQLYLDAFPLCIELPRPPLANVVSVQYRDANGDLQTLAGTAYQVDAHLEPARIIPAVGALWPQTRQMLDAVIVEYVAGYGAASAVPADIKAAILLLVGTLYENREDTAPVAIQIVPRSAEYVLWPYRLVPIA